MPRRPREYSSTGIYHVMVRGNERKTIFNEDEDRERFLWILEQKKSEGEYDLYAYCLMDNHVHLIIKENKNNITRIMKRINTSYASYYNKKYDRVGHVFQDRYKSEAIEQEIYLLEAIKYVHNNPVKARLVADPKKYPWSSFPLYLDCSSYKSGLIACSEILEMYGQNRKDAVQRMIEYTSQKDNNDFLDIQLKEAREERLEVVIKSFLQEKNIELQALRKDKELRAELILILKESAGYSVRRIAEALGVDRNIVQRTSKE